MIPIFLVLLLPWQALSDSCHSVYTLPGFKIHGHLLKAILLQSKSGCEKMCASQEGCNSISFHQNTRKCELHDGNHISHPESVLPSEGYIYVNFPKRPPKRCSRKLCSRPLACVPEGDSYNCVSCEEAGQVLNFPRKSTEDHAILDEPFTSSLSAFTLSLWVQVDTSTRSNTAFSYGTPLHVNAISIFIYPDAVSTTIIDSHASHDDINYVIDGNWHHISLTWENTNGNAKLYIDGVLRSSRITKQGEVISKGVFVLGQDQDVYRGDFDSAQALKGNIASVNLWSRDFTSGEVSALAMTCPTIEGDIVQWSTLKTKAAGQAKLVCSNFCM